MTRFLNGFSPRSYHLQMTSLQVRRMKWKKVWKVFGAGMDREFVKKKDFKAYLWD